MLIECPECGSKISTKAPLCPGCGVKHKALTIWKIGQLIGLLATIGGCVFTNIAFIIGGLILLFVSSLGTEWGR